MPLLWLVVAGQVVAQTPDTAARDSAWVPVRGLTQRLADAGPAVHVTPGPGVAGWGARVRIRGGRTLVDGRVPLVLFDGIRIENITLAFPLTATAEPGLLRLDDVAPEDVDSLGVVVGSAAAGRYGPDASNGVLLLRTPDGTIGRPRWTMSASASARSPYLGWPSTFGGVDADNADSAMRDGGCGINAVALGLCVQDSVQSFNPLVTNSQFQTGWARQLRASVAGGSSRIRYFFSARRAEDGGTFQLSTREADVIRSRGQPLRDATVHPDGDDRWNVLTTIDLHPIEPLEIRLTGSRFSGELRLPLMSPLLISGLGGGSSARATDGWSRTGLGRPADFFPIENSLDAGRWIGVARVRWRPTRRLSVHAVLGQDELEYDGRQLLRPGEGRPGAFGPAGSLLLDTRSVTTKTFLLRAEYLADLDGGIQSTTSIGLEDLKGRRETRRELGVPVAPDWRTINPTGPREVLQTAGRSRDRSFFAEERLDYRGLIQVQGTLRQDIFGGTDANVLHPTLNGFWTPRPGLTVRVGYGVAGRRPLTDEAERTRELTAGVDASFWRGRARVALTWYDERSDVLATPLPSLGSVTVLPAGRATLSNRGVELLVNGTLWNRPATGATVSIGVWADRNRLVTMSVAPWGVGTLAPQLYRPGFLPGGYWVFGVRYNDSDGDGLIRDSEVTLDQASHWAGSPYPTQGATLATDVRAGRFRLGTRFEYQAGHTLFNDLRMIQCSSRRCPTSVELSTPLSQQAEAASHTGADGFFENADFLKLREVSVSFDLPATLLRALRLSGATIVLAGYNLATWTGYSGTDPEGIRAEPAIGQPDLVAGGYFVPPLREWSLGVRLSY